VHNFLERTLFEPIAPIGFFLDVEKIENTKEFLRNKKIYKQTLSCSYSLGLETTMNFTLRELYDCCERVLKKSKYVSRIESLLDESEYDDSIVAVNDICQFKLKNNIIKLRYKYTKFEAEMSFNSFLKCNNAQYVQYLEKLLERIFLEIKQEYLNKMKSVKLFPDKFHNTIEKIKRFTQVSHKYPQLRWVFLVHGEPGTGKTWLFNQIPSVMSNCVVSVDSDMQKRLNDYYNSLSTYKDDGGSPKPSSPSSWNSKPHRKLKKNINSGRVPHLRMEIIDEFDKYVGNYVEENSIDQKKSFMVSRFKEELDKTSGIIILITNHKDKIDPSVIRDGRVNEVIMMEKDFYTVEEKRNIFEYYKTYYGLPEEYDVSNSELGDMTVASIEANSKNKMLEYGNQKLKEKMQEV